LLGILLHANAITSFTVNDVQSLVLEGDDSISLTFKADTFRPGGSLIFEIYLDLLANGVIDSGDVNLLSNFDFPYITDGVSGQPGDEDGVVNSKIMVTVNYKDYFLADLMFPSLVFRAVDEDGSSAVVSILVKQPEYAQAVSGQVADVNGNPVEGMIVIAHPEYRYDLLEEKVVDEWMEEFVMFNPMFQPIS